MTKYTREEFLEAYERWRGTQAMVEHLDVLTPDQAALAVSVRNAAWDDYCDARDWLRKGTSRARRLIRLERDNVVPIKGH